MFFFSRVHTEKDINATKLGKLRTYRLARNDRTLRFRGKLLGYYCVSNDCLTTQAQRQPHVDTIAIFKVGIRYLLYYVVQSLDKDQCTVHQAGVHAAPALDGLAAFIAHMNYANKRSFAHAVIDDARSQDK